MFELILLAPVDEVETLSEALDALDALSVSVEDADAQTPAEQALFGEPDMPPPKPGWERSRIVSLFALFVLQVVPAAARAGGTVPGGQTATSTAGAITGRITDATGAVLSGVTVAMSGSALMGATRRGLAVRRWRGSAHAVFPV